jgi:hypothetical protein
MHELGDTVLASRYILEREVGLKRDFAFAPAWNGLAKSQVRAYERGLLLHATLAE